MNCPGRLLSEAQGRIDSGKLKPAARKLHDYIDRINSLVTSGRLTDEAVAGQLIQDAEDVIIVIAV